MLYKLNHNDGVIEFVKNLGQVTLDAPDEDAALKAAHDLFEFTRQEKVSQLPDGKFRISFMVSLDYQLKRVRQVEKAVKMLRTWELFYDGRYIDRYIVANVYRETGKPEYLKGIDIKREITLMRKAAVVSREVSDVIRFVEWDICIHNYIELNSKEGFKSRVVRDLST